MSRGVRKNPGKIFAVCFLFRVAEGFQRVWYGGINEAYSTIRKNNKFFL